MKNYTNTYPLSVALFEPRIPQNTGNIARTCAAFNLPLHLIKPLGFSIEDKFLKRAGLDYWPYMNITVHQNFELFNQSLSSSNRLIGFSKSAESTLDKLKFTLGDILLFGREDLGLPDTTRCMCHKIMSIPMPGGVDPNTNLGVRSLNLASAVAIAAYEGCLNLDLL
ncbi:tRNA (cytidine(34)-2'-O)-methyltransferase [Prochlorococcus sp. MIT 1307]|uniref:tRNA (cytidine(34)-2'-O)-methyltransferase n=1 Tax=Prochlorococcus sp. MIT 1307 TaxID=3096219 RepID=UPI002A760AB5|nr:tRNA (cytidine(34)-2'-O)-methyltransferase [Prochlorococcus sp. MIT 1307]